MADQLTMSYIGNKAFDDFEKIEKEDGCNYCHGKGYVEELYVDQLKRKTCLCQINSDDDDRDEREFDQQKDEGTNGS